MTPEETAGIRIVLTSVQLAAVLAEDYISEDATWTNRLWGGLRRVGGVVKLAGAGARQVLSGRDIRGLTHSGTAALASCRTKFNPSAN